MRLGHLGQPSLAGNPLQGRGHPIGIAIDAGPDPPRNSIEGGPTFNALRQRRARVGKRVVRTPVLKARCSPCTWEER
jgi:hypothetical protein